MLIFLTKSCFSIIMCLSLRLFLTRFSCLKTLQSLVHVIFPSSGLLNQGGQVNENKTTLVIVINCHGATSQRMSTFELTPGTAFQCLSIPVKFEKVAVFDNNTGEHVGFRCGFSIGGGIDQDYHYSPGYTDNGIYVTDVVIEGPAFKGGLRVGDKILQCNGYDFTMVSHKQAVDLIKRSHALELLIARKGVTQQ